MFLPVCAQRKFDGGKVPWSAICYPFNLIMQYVYIWTPKFVAILRLILCCSVVLARRAIFIIENPHGSLIFRHHRFEYLTNLVAFEPQLKLICSSVIFEQIWMMTRNISLLVHNLLVPRSIVKLFGWVSLEAKHQRGFWLGQMIIWSLLWISVSSAVRNGNP